MIAVKIAVCVLAALILTVIAYVLYVVLQYRRIEDNKKLEIVNDSEKKVRTGEIYVICTYNIGFGAYDKDFSFFMDTGRMIGSEKVIRGKYGKAISREAVLRNTDGAIQIAKSVGADFMLFQEVDTKSDRARKVNQLAAIRDAFPAYTCVFAENFHTAYLLYPLSDPHGKTNAGIVTLTNARVEKSVRRSFPVSSGFAKFFDLDRCFSVSYLPVENSDKQFVVINQHMSAYDKGGEIRKLQWKMLAEVMTREYEKGNFVLVGGDFNHDIAGSIGFFPTRQQKPDWVCEMSESDLPKHFSFASALNAPTCRGSEMEYKEGVNYTVVIDGFIVSDNIEIVNVSNIQTDFEFTDHNPAKMSFRLK